MSLAQALTNLSLTDQTSPSDLLFVLDKADLLVVSEKTSVVINEPSKVTKRAIVEALVSEITNTGTKKLTQLLKRQELETLMENIKIDHKGNNPKNRQVLSKRLYENITDSGIDQFLQDHASAEALKLLIDALAISLPASAKKDEKIGQVSLAVDRIGMQMFFARMDLDMLQYLCEQMKIETHDRTNSAALIHAIIMQQNLPKKEKKISQKPKKTKKKALVEGITYDEVFQHYYLDEIQDWCKENKLKTTGTKKVLIKRILAFFDGDKENTLASTNVKSPKSPKKAASKKTETPSSKPAKGKKGSKKVTKEEPVEDSTEEPEKEEVKEEPKVTPKSKSKKGCRVKEKKPEEQAQRGTSTHGSGGGRGGGGRRREDP